MTIKTLAAAVALTIIPAMGFAYECNYGKQKQASMSCAEGSVKTHYSRAIHTLREELGEHWP